MTTTEQLDRTYHFILEYFVQQGKGHTSRRSPKRFLCPRRRGKDCCTI